MVAIERIRKNERRLQECHEKKIKFHYEMFVLIAALFERLNNR